MGDAGEGLIDAEARIQERMEELEREKTRQNHGKIVRDPEKVHALESLRLARTELDRQLVATANERRREHQPIQAPQKRGQRLAAAGRRENQRRVAVGDCRPAKRLRGCRRLKG